jgi:RNA polymerase sigma-70 factor (ECF subfamily)
MTEADRVSQSLSDEELVRRSLNGDRSAFGVLAERYARQVVAVAYALVRDREKARDLAQESFLTAYEALRGLREIGQFGRWLVGITRRRCIYAIRRERRAARALAVRAEMPSREAVDPGRETVRLDEESRLLAALARLGRRYREVLVLRHFESRSYAEIAEMLDLSLATVEKRLTRARNRLRELLENGSGG